MKKWIKELIIMGLILIVASGIIGYYRSSSVNTDLKLIENLKTIDNRAIKDILAQKKPLILNFWGTWCPVCNQEVSTLSKLAKREDITLLTIASNSGSNSEIQSYMQKKGISFLVINDQSGSLAKAFGISVFPTTLFYNSKRTKTIKDSGYTTYPGFLARIKLVEQ